MAKAKPKVVVQATGPSEEDPGIIEGLLKEHIPNGLKWKRDTFPMLGFMWDWQKDGWQIDDASGNKVASIYMDGRHILVWGRLNIEVIKPLAEVLAKALNSDIVISLA